MCMQKVSEPVADDDKAKSGAGVWGKVSRPGTALCNIKVERIDQLEPRRHCLRCLFV